MLIPYSQFERSIYEGLRSLHEQDPGFTFSVRQNGSKGAELDYFIGTAKSRYFGFTCWTAPIYFPGSSADLVDYFFSYGEGGRLHFNMVASAPKKAEDPQLLGCLAFVHHLRKLAGSKGLKVQPDAEEKKFVDYVRFPEPRLFNSFEELWSAFVPFLRETMQLVDDAISITKVEHPEWQAERISGGKFNDYIMRMNTRFERYNYLRQKPALQEGEVTEIIKTIKDSKVRSHALNQILYGPPGTGKTYHTINKAIEIIDQDFYDNHKHNRKALLDKFNRLLIKDWTDPKGQIAFTSFHQSMSYEDFIEGIKPVADETTSAAGTSDIRYEIKDGIFKLMAQKSSWKQGNFTQVLEAFKNDCSELLNKPVITITAQYTTFDVAYRGTAVFYVSPHNTTVQKPWYPVNIENIRKVYETGDYKGIYNPTYVREILSYLHKNKSLTKATDSKDENAPHVLIIDEINRGNIAQIFGELITLIESGKRAGKDEQLEVMLTYSKEPFSVPSNLYIIGTMNTADRSVETLDTALRRRFTFHEMMPDPALLSPYNLLAKFYDHYDHIDWEPWKLEYAELARDFYEFVGLQKFEIGSEEEMSLYKQFEIYRTNPATEISAIKEYGLEPEINVQDILETINKRIEVLYDKEHTIGHSFFFELISKDHPLTGLRQVFKEEIIPLLQEYFFGDYAKIGLVLGKSFIKNKYPARLKPDFFAEFPGVAVEDYARAVYEFNPGPLEDNEQFRKALIQLVRKPVSVPTLELNEPA